MNFKSNSSYSSKVISYALFKTLVESCEEAASIYLAYNSSSVLPLPAKGEILTIILAHPYLNNL